MLHKHEPLKINVLARFSSFEEDGQQRRIIPLSFTRPNGKTYEISQVRSSYSERVGDSVHVHFVVRIGRDTYYNIVYDSQAMTWFLILELKSNWIPDPDELSYRGQPAR